MSTITRTPPSTAASPPPSASHAATIPGEQRIAIRDIPWDLYDRLSDAIGERQNVHLAYDGKDLEIMVTGPTHEDAKESFQVFVKAVAFELRIRCRGLGQTTWKRPESLRGIEADLCYFFDPAKLAIVADARTRRSNNVADYPNPDLAIEIDISPSQIDRPSIYRALNVKEVWRFDGRSLVIEQLRGDGTYGLADSSQFLPVRAEEVLRWLIEENSNDETAWEVSLREWARSELAPRLIT
jgi:Uma2 family endonuclease